jgi:hypothetical protein
MPRRGFTSPTGGLLRGGAPLRWKRRRGSAPLPKEAGEARGPGRQTGRNVLPAFRQPAIFLFVWYTPFHYAMQ